MTPEQVSALSAVATIISKVGAWPIGSVVALIVLGPWIFQVYISRAQEARAEAERDLYRDKFDQVTEQQKQRFDLLVRMYDDARLNQERKFEAVVRMYESNVDLVKDYQLIAKNLQDLVLYNTQTMQQVLEISRNNLYCPILREKTKGGIQ